MLDPWIIEEILRREEERKHEEDQRRRVELPVDSPRYIEGEPQPGSKREEDGERGVTVIDI